MEPTTVSVLADDDCRRVVKQLLGAGTETMTVRKLATSVATADDGEEQTRIRLHHCVLPKLAEAGIVEYDWSNETVRFSGDQGKWRRIANTVAPDAESPLAPNDAA